MEKLTGLVVAVSPVYRYIGYGERSVVVKKGALLIGEKLRRVMVYDEAKMAIIKAGNKVVVTDYRIDEHSNVLIFGTHKIYQCGFSVVTGENKKAGYEALIAPVNAVVELSEVKKSPQKRKLSVRGMVSAGSPSSTTAKVRKMTLANEVNVNLWRSCTEVEVNVGDTVQLNDVTVSYDTLTKENVLSVNRPDQLIVLSDVDVAEQRVYVVNGVAMEANKVMAMCSCGGFDMELEIDMCKVIEACKVCDIEGVIGLIPFSVEGRAKDGHLVDISML